VNASRARPGAAARRPAGPARCLGVASRRAKLDDAAVISAVEALAVDERGLALGLLVSGGGADAAGCLADPGRERCRAALEALAASEEARATARAALAAELSAPVPAGLEEVHPGWIRGALEGEPVALVRAVVRGLPPEVGRVADELLRGRGAAPGALARLPEGPGLDGLRRTLFGNLAPMPPGAPGSMPRARALCALPRAALVDEVDRRGAAALGLALAGAPDAVVARAAAAAGEPAARALLAAAKGPSTPDARAAARALVEDVPAPEAARGAVRAVGLRAMAREVAPEGVAALAAVAQRLSPAVGERLLACARGVGPREAP
jgi:hypothetical protein